MPDDTQSSAGQVLSDGAEEASILESFKQEFTKFDGYEDSPPAKATQEQDSAKESERATDTAETTLKADGDAADDITQPDNSEAYADDAPKSSYQARISERDRLAADQKRLAKNWQEFSEGKLKWQQSLQQELAAVKQQLSQPRQQPQQPTGEARFSSQEFAKASEWYEGEARKAIQEGDPDKARDLLDKASQTRTAAQRQFGQEQQAMYLQAQDRFVNDYRSVADKVLSEHKELNEDNNPVWLKMQELLNQEPVFTSHPNGFQWAYKYARGLVADAEASELRGKVTEYEKKFKEWENRTQLRGGTLTKPLNRDVDGMGDDEQEAFLRQQFVRANSE